MRRPPRCKRASRMVVGTVGFAIDLIQRHKQAYQSNWRMEYCHIKSIDNHVEHCLAKWEPRYWIWKKKWRRYRKLVAEGKYVKMAKFWGRWSRTHPSSGSWRIGLSFKNIKIKSINKNERMENEKRFYQKKRQREVQPLSLGRLVMPSISLR